VRIGTQPDSLMLVRRAARAWHWANAWHIRGTNWFAMHGLGQSAHDPYDPVSHGPSGVLTRRARTHLGQTTRTPVAPRQSPDLGSSARSHAPKLNPSLPKLHPLLSL
jgi:hypothetical protein